MKKNKLVNSGKRLLLGGFALLIIFIGATAYTHDDGNDFEIVKSLDIFYSVFRELNAHYVDPVDAGGLIQKAIDAMLNSLDPYTVYYPESRIEEYRFMTTGEYGGVGINLHNYNNRYIITELYADYPAAESGIKVGDEIRFVQQNDISDFTIDEIGELLKGQANSIVNITIFRPADNKKYDFQIQRKNIKVSSVPYATVLKDSVGYISLTGFTENASGELRDALTGLKEQGISSLILDLRGNPGGLLLESVNIVNLFVDKGLEIVSTRGKIEAQNKVFKTRFDVMEPDLPVAVLINRGSASASEIVAGALQDFDRAVIIGERSFGKGLVQNTLSLDYNTRMKVTTAKYYIPSGRCIQALDYTHRRDDGSVGNMPDSLISEFKTTTGRIVYDGGGVLPDIEVEQGNYLTITKELMREMVVFDFVTRYMYENTIELQQLPLGDKLFDDFKIYVDSQGFTYKSETQKQFDRLLTVAQKEDYLELAKAEFEAFELKIEDMKNNDMQLAKMELLKLINEEIAHRIGFRKAKIKVSIENDSYMDAAQHVLGNPGNYKRLLLPK